MSTLYIYPDCKITKERNCLVDNIQAYLQTQRILPSIEIQYQQIELYKTLKLNMSQSVVGTGPFNYLEIIQDNKSFYYFIDKTNWKSTSTVEFELTLDTVNTFATDFSFDKKTRITRQHKDRLEIRDKVKQNTEVWEYVPANTQLVLNPWAYENEMHDTFYIRWGTDTVNCSLVLYANGKEVHKINNVYSIEQGYFGQSGVAMKISYLENGQSHEVVKEYADLINEFNNGAYSVVKFIGNTSDMVYDPNDAWPSLFYGYYNRYFMRKIDQKEEGLNPPLFKYDTDNVIHSIDDIPWNLVYIATNSYDPDNPEAFLQSNPLQCFLYPSQAISLNTVRSEGSTYTANDFTEGTYYYFLPGCVVPDGVRDSAIDKYYFIWGAFGKDVSYSVKATQTDFSDYQKYYATTSKWHYHSPHSSVANYTKLDQVPRWFKLRKNGLFIEITQYSYIIDSAFNFNKIYTAGTHIYSAASFKLQFITNYGVLPIFTGNVDPSTQSYITYWNSIKTNTESEILDFGNLMTYNLEPIPESLKTDSRVMKIVQIPYCPLGKWLKDKDLFYNINGWVYDSTNKAFRKINIEADTNSSITLSWNPLELLKLDYVEPSSSANRNDKYESKLYHSEFYTPKLVYDSFNYTYRLENVDSSNVDNLNNANEIGYKVSNTFSGNFMFNTNVPLTRSVSDYDNIMIVNRNNELPVYTSAFMNYVRTGYNWDVKNKNLGLTKSIISTAGAGIAGAAAGAMKGAAGGPYAAAGGAAIGAVAGVSGGLLNLAFSQIQADNNIKQKLEESNRQGVSVNDCDDINLLQAYTDGNKAKQVAYQASTAVIDTVRDLFYYFGYNEDIRAIPKLNSRLWFNYIECEPVFKENNNLVYKNYLEDIRQRFMNGITVYHRVNNTYDWNQEKENWEINLIDRGL